MDNDEKLIRKAKARIGFRIHSVIYFIVCLALTLFDIFIDSTGCKLVVFCRWWLGHWFIFTFYWYNQQ